jgi:hypothetical protein
MFSTVRTRRWLTIVAKVVVSLWILFHFGGIVLEQRFPASPWLNDKLWLYIYRPYLQLIAQEGAHNYFVEPRYYRQLWFHVDYGAGCDGAVHGRWICVPGFRSTGQAFWPDGVDRPHVQQTRLHALAGSLQFHSPPSRGPDEVQRRLMARTMAGAIDDVPLPNNHFVEPTPTSKRWLASYVRHVARTYQDRSAPELPARAIRVYIVSHVPVEPNHVAEGVNLWEDRFFVAYYQGEFDRDGSLIDPADPYLYWSLPAQLLPDSDELYDQGVMVRASPDR